MLARELMPGMIERKFGRIVALSSQLAEVGGSIGHILSGQGRAIYSASKAGLVALTKGMAHEGAPYVTANVVAPSGTRQQIAEERGSELSGMHPLPRIDLRRLLLDLRDETGDGGSAMNQIHPRYQHTLDDLFLQVFVLIDDFLQPFEPQLPSQAHQKASISEILTIAIVGEILAQPFESVWYWLVTQNHQDLFPSLPHPSRYHRILRNSERLIAQLALSVTGEQQGVKLIDSKPLPVAKGKRASWAKLPEAEKGFSTMGMVFGFKLHALVSEAGLFRRWLFAPASCSDVRAGRELTQDLEGDRVLGDKAYVGSDAITPARKNMHDQGIWCLWMSRARKRIETSFSTLVRSLTLHAAQVKTFRSLRTRVNLKIAAFNLMHSGALNG